MTGIDPNGNQSRSHNDEEMYAIQAYVIGLITDGAARPGTTALRWNAHGENPVAPDLTVVLVSGFSGHRSRAEPNGHSGAPLAFAACAAKLVIRASPPQAATFMTFSQAYGPGRF